MVRSSFACVWEQFLFPPLFVAFSPILGLRWGGEAPAMGLFRTWAQSVRLACKPS